MPYTCSTDFGCTVSFTLEFVTFFNNILVIATIYGTPKLRKICNIYIFNLAIADLLIGTILTTLDITIKPSLIISFSEPIEYILKIPVLWIHQVSSWNSVVISMDRYTAVKMPLHYQNVARKRAPIILSCLWILSLLEVIIIILIEILIPPNDQSHSASLTWTFYIIIIQFFLPTSFMLYYYWKIFKIVKSVTKVIRQNTLTTEFGSIRMHVGHDNNQVNSAISTISTAELDVSVITRRLRATKAIKTISIIVGVHLATCSTLYIIYPIMRYFQSKKNECFTLFCRKLIIANSALNPLIYVLLNKNYRLGLKRILLCGYK